MMGRFQKRSQGQGEMSYIVRTSNRNNTGSRTIKCFGKHDAEKVAARTGGVVVKVPANR